MTEHIEAIGLTLELPDGGQVIRGEGSLLQFAPPVEIGVWYGAGQTVERWREGALQTWPGVTFAQGRLLEAWIPAQAGAEGGFPAPGGGVDYRGTGTPEKIAVVAGFEHGGTPVLLSWTVEAERREELRPAEQRFFAVTPVHE